MSIPRDSIAAAALAALLLGAGLAACSPAGDDNARAGTPTLPAEPATALPAPAYPGAAQEAGSTTPSARSTSLASRRGTPVSTGAITSARNVSASVGAAEPMTDTSGATAAHTDAGVASSSARTLVGPSQGLSGDPLSTAEMDRARQLALGASEVRGMLAAAADRDGLIATSGRGTELGALLADRPTYRVLYTQRAPEKGSDKRMAEIALYRYDTGEGSLSKVDLTSGAVSSQSVPDDVYLPLVPAEIDEAAQVARADDRVKAQLRAAGLDELRTAANGLLTTGEEDGSPCRLHRCVRLFFSSTDKPVPAFSVTVDLVDVGVVEVTPIPMEGVNR